MSFSLGEENDKGMTEINLVPLIDIMLVLMIIFLVTATVANPSIPLTLPQTTAKQQQEPPKVITISINSTNQVAWNGEVISLDELATRFNQAAADDTAEKPSIQLRADKDSKYDTTAQVMSRASQAGLSDIAFVSQN